MNATDQQYIETIVTKAIADVPKTKTPDNARLCLSCTDYTTLRESDTPSSVKAFTDYALDLIYQGLPPVASLCVYPSLVESAGIELGESPIAITAVCGGFPSGQTYIEVKMLECAMAVENGADEIDIVINLGALLDGEYDIASSEIETLREEIGEDAILKVILETGTLVAPDLIYQSSMLAMQAGADFLKTSTGKTPVGATPAAAAIICTAIRDYHAQSGRRVGFKASGGVSTLDQALTYHNIVKDILGQEWLMPELFRLGSSRLVSNIVKYLHQQ